MYPLSKYRFSLHVARTDRAADKIYETDIEIFVILRALWFNITNPGVPCWIVEYDVEL